MLKRIVEFMLHPDIREKLNGINIARDKYRAMFGSKTLNDWATFNWHNAGARRFGIGLSADNANFFVAKGVAGAETEVSSALVNKDTYVWNFNYGIKVGTTSGAINDGVVIRSGLGTPSFSLGQDGDIYIRKDGDETGTVFQRRNGGYVKLI